MSSLHPKFTVSVYQPGLEFNQDAFDTKRGFAIHTMKATDPPQDLPTMYQSKYYKDKLNESAARKMYQANLQETLSQTASTLSGMALAKSQLVQSPTSPDSNSKVKSRLQKDMELANQYVTEAEEPEVKPSTSRVPEPQEEYYQIGKPAKSTGKVSTSVVGSPKNRFVRSFNPFSTTPNFMTSTGRSGTSSPDYIKLRSKSSALKKTLYYDTRINSIPKTAVKNDVIEGLIDNEDMILTNPVLLESVIKLRDMKLLKAKVPGVNRYKGIGKVDYVYNDFHSRSTNPGYSRNHGGVFYFR